MPDDRALQVAQAEANLVLLRGTVIGALAMADLTGGGAMVETTVQAEVDERGFTGDAIITRNGVRYRVTIDYA